MAVKVYLLSIQQIPAYKYRSSRLEPQIGVQNEGYFGYLVWNMRCEKILPSSLLAVVRSNNMTSEYFLSPR